jgi:hypothetical protein
MQKATVQRKMGSISLIMVTISIIISTGFSVYDSYVQRKNLKTAFEEICGPIPSHLAESIGKSVWFMDKESIKKLIETQMSYSRVFAIVVKENTGKVFAASRDNNWNIIPSDGKISGNYILKKEKIVYNKKNIGEAEVYFTTRFEDEAFRKIIVFMIVKVLSMSILLVFVLLLIVKKFLIKPMRNIVHNLNQISHQVGNAMEQLSIVTRQLTTGSSHQAAAIQETSSSLEQMTAMNSQNTDNAGLANHQMFKTSERVSQAVESMRKLIVSMEKISQNSETTRNVIKTIEEIGFQTRLLSLNAAVEAARSGAAGAGFAVVADEVKNLAVRSSEAAQNTAALIENSIQSTREGFGITSKLDEIFTYLSDDAQKVKELLSEVDAGSKQQLQGISEIGTAMNEIEKVTQENMTGVEETNSTVQKIVGQVESMKKEISELVRLTGNAKKRAGNLIDTKNKE